MIYWDIWLTCFVLDWSLTFQLQVTLSSEISLNPQSLLSNEMRVYCNLAAPLLSALPLYGLSVNPRMCFHQVHDTLLSIFLLLNFLCSFIYCISTIHHSYGVPCMKLVSIFDNMCFYPSLSFQLDLLPSSVSWKSDIAHTKKHNLLPFQNCF